MKFEALNVGKPMITLLEQHNITIPTPIQEEIIPAIKEGRDVLAQSETGSGKTVSFAIPILEEVKRSDGLTTLVLVPTRELCVQVAGEFIKFSHGKHLGITSVYGGVSINQQARKMKTTNIIVATPGRLIDLLDRHVVALESIRYLVLDEADRMLDMGFIPDVEKILKKMPQKKQTMLFSATVSKEIESLSLHYLIDPKLVSLESKVRPEFLHQTYFQVIPDHRLSLLTYLLQHEHDLALVFCNKKHLTAKIAKRLSAQGIGAKCLHGDMSQPQRERVTADFRNKKINVLIATDVAARGLHIADISHVYNYEIPRDVESYTHRVGRTARAGKKGEAISFVATDEDRKFFKQILFSYQGNITLKKISTADLPIIDSVKRETSKPPVEPKQSRQVHAGKEKGHRQPKRSEMGGKGTEANKHEDRKKSPRVESRDQEDASTHRGRHQPRPLNRDIGKKQSEYRPSSQETTGKKSNVKTDQHSKSIQGKVERPRRRKPYEEESRKDGYRDNNIPIVERRREPKKDEEGNKKLNWKEMWQRLVGG